MEGLAFIDLQFFMYSGYESSVQYICSILQIPPRHCVACLFTLLTMFFDEEKFLTLM